MKILQHGRKRKAISPVLATVILIAITLIAAIAVAGFVFGLFGSFTHTATISGAVTTCTSVAGLHGDICNVVLTNTGTGNAAVTGCSLSVSGVTEVGTAAPLTTVVAGATGTVYTCTAGVAGDVAQTPGSMAGGAFTLSNGGSVAFSGTWSA